MLRSISRFVKVGGPSATNISCCRALLGDDQYVDKVRRLNGRYIGTDSGAYQGDGKTTVEVLNNDDKRINLINTYSPGGFRLSNNLFVRGSLLLFPTFMFSWQVRRVQDITLDSLLVLSLIVPKVKLVVIGYGTEDETQYFDATIPIKLKQMGISCEALPTSRAVTTYNYMVNDATHVAGAFLPPQEDFRMTKMDHLVIHEMDDMLESRGMGVSLNPNDRMGHMNDAEFLETVRKNEAYIKPSKKRFED